MNEHIVSGSKHFTLHELAEDIFAVIAVDGGAAICNAGLIDLGGQILLFDAFLTPQAALDLRRFAIEQFGRAPQIVVDSHYHNDHIWGNQAFAPDALIISSARTRQLIATEGMEELRWNSANAAQRLELMRVQYQNTSDEQEREDLNLWMGEFAGIVEALPHLTVCLPDITFKDQLEIYGAKHTARLITFEGGHSGSDTVLHLPQDGIVFMSDLLFVDFHPYLADGDPLKTLEALRELSQLNAACYVPGHGPIGTVEDVKLQMRYIEQCFDTAQRLVDAGDVNEESIKELKIAELFQHWRMAQFYRTNIRFICGRLNAAKADKQAPDPSD